MELALGLMFIAALVAYAIYNSAQNRTPAPRPSPHLVCPHCQSKGTVTAVPVTRKKGVSGGKGTAALLTAGMSLVAVGLSRKEPATLMVCSNCGTNWDV